MFIGKFEGGGTRHHSPKCLTFTPYVLQTQSTLLSIVAVKYMAVVVEWAPFHRQ